MILGTDNLQELKIEHGGRDLEFQSLHGKLKNLEERLYSGVIKKQEELESLHSEIQYLHEQARNEEEEILRVMFSLEEAEQSMSNAAKELSQTEVAWEKAQADKKADKKEDSATEDNEGEESDDELEGSNEKVEEVEEEWVEAVPDTMAYSLDTEFTALVASEADERDAAWTPDGRSILYSSDRTDVFNVYIKDLETGEERQVTNVIGGAFVPSMTRDGNEIVYAGYHASNYSIYRVTVANAASVASTDNLEREYRELYTGPGIDDVWT